MTGEFVCCRCPQLALSRRLAKTALRSAAGGRSDEAAAVRHFWVLTHSGRVANHTRWWLSKKAIEKRACPLDGVVRSRTVVLDAMAEVSAPRQHRHVVEAVVGGRIVYDVKQGRTLGHQRLEHPAILSRGPVVLVADQHQRRQGKPGVCRGTAIGIVGHATLDADRRQVLLQGVEYRGSAMGEAEQGQAIAANEWLAGEVFRRADDIDNAEVG